MGAPPDRAHAGRMRLEEPTQSRLDLVPAALRAQWPAVMAGVFALSGALIAAAIAAVRNRKR